MTSLTGQDWGPSLLRDPDRELELVHRQHRRLYGSRPHENRSLAAAAVPVNAPAAVGDVALSRSTPQLPVQPLDPLDPELTDLPQQPPEPPLEEPPNAAFPDLPDLLDLGWPFHAQHSLYLQAMTAEHARRYSDSLRSRGTKRLEIAESVASDRDSNYPETEAEFISRLRRDGQNLLDAADLVAPVMGVTDENGTCGHDRSGPTPQLPELPETDLYWDDPISPDINIQVPAAAALATHTGGREQQTPHRAELPLSQPDIREPQVSQSFQYFAVPASSSDHEMPPISPNRLV